MQSSTAISSTKAATSRKPRSKSGKAGDAKAKRGTWAANVPCQLVPHKAMEAEKWDIIREWQSDMNLLNFKARRELCMSMHEKQYQGLPRGPCYITLTPDIWNLTFGYAVNLPR
jgi:hypothetical protein